MEGILPVPLGLLLEIIHGLGKTIPAFQENWASITSEVRITDVVVVGVPGTTTWLFGLVVTLATGATLTIRVKGSPTQ